MRVFEHNELADGVCLSDGHVSFSGALESCSANVYKIRRTIDINLITLSIVPSGDFSADVAGAFGVFLLLKGMAFYNLLDHLSESGSEIKLGLQ